MAASKSFNPRSPKQVGELLYDVIGAKPIKGKKATGEKLLNQIAEQHPICRLFIEHLLLYREKAKAISTYFEFPQWQGRLLYGINPFGTDTGRAASHSSSFRLYDEAEKKEADRIKSYGTQIQNMPPYAKNMLIADEGYELGEADNNKSEARCVGYLSECLGLIAALSDDAKDFYKTLGTIFFGIPYEDVSKELRNSVLKRIVHGRNYLMGATTFIEHVGAAQLYEGARLLNYSVKTLKAFAEYLLSLYNKPFPEFEDWYKEIKLEVVRSHTLVSPTGYTRYFFGDIMRDHRVFRGAVAHAPQNLSVMILNKGLWNVYTQIVLKEQGRFRLKAQIHDSIFWQSKIGMREYYKYKVLKCMDNPTTIKGRIMRIPVDVNFGHSWLDLKV
jgi:DNA polymerase-1